MKNLMSTFWKVYTYLKLRYFLALAKMASYEKSEHFLNLFSKSFNKNESFRIIDIMFTGSPVGKRNNADDALRVQAFTF